MNNFPLAYEAILKNEGGYVNDPADPGGETYAGISRKNYPDWPGWKALDAVAVKKSGQKIPALNNTVSEFYYNNYWLKYSLDKLDSPEISAAALDTVVNHGRGAYLIQKALKDLGKSVSVDGKLGPATLSLLNMTSSADYLPALYNVRQDYYQALVAQNPSLSKFLPGWLKRIDGLKGGAVATAGIGFLGFAALCAGLWYYFRKSKFGKSKVA